MIRIADINSNNSDNGIKKMVLTIFRKLIEIKANQYSKRATEWEYEDWVENKESVEEMQN